MTTEPSSANPEAVAGEPARPLGLDPKEFGAAMRRRLRAHWKLFAFQGVVLVILGTIAISVPRFAAIAATDFLGWLLFFSGLFGAVSIVRSPRAPGYWPSLLLAVLTASLGFILAWYPLQGAITLTMLLTAYFIVQGIGTLMLAFSFKGETGRWVLLLLSGIVDLLLAGFVIAEWPSTETWD